MKHISTNYKISCCYRNITQLSLVASSLVYNFDAQSNMVEINMTSDVESYFCIAISFF